MISREHRAIFIHPPKTGGSSIEMALGLYDDPLLRRQDHTTLRATRPITRRHLSALLKGPTLREHRIGRKEMLRSFSGLNRGARATREEFESFFRFTVVRNPWARVHSWYRNVMRYRRSGPRMPFPEFVFSGERPADTWALRPQLYWLEDFDRSLPYHQIVRFERFAEEVEEVFYQIGIGGAELPHALDYGSRSDYREAYDDTTAEYVARRYAREIALFGYEFDRIC